MLTALCRRRRAWQLAQRWSAALHQAAAAAGQGASAEGPSTAADGQAEDVRQLKSVLQRYQHKPQARGRKLGGGRVGAAARGAAASRAEAPGTATLLHLERPPKYAVTPMSLTPAARQARQEQAVALNKAICRRFDDVDRRLAAGGMPASERLAAGQQCLDAVAQSLHLVMDDVNLSTFFHRIARLVAHPAMQVVRPQLQTQRVISGLLQRFEGMLDRIIRQEAWRAQQEQEFGASPAAKPARSSSRQPDLHLSPRALSSSFWALGHMRYPLGQELLDKIGGVVMLNYSRLQPHHLSMLISTLNAYNNAPFEGKLMRVLLERFRQLPIQQLEARTLLNVMCATGAAGMSVSQPMMDHLSLAALACLPEIELTYLGSLVWSLGKLGSKLGASRIAPPVLHAVAAVAWRRLDEVAADTLNDILYGFGLLNFHPGEEFMDAAAVRLRELLPEMTAQQVASSVWSFARLEYSPDPDRDLWALSSSRAAGQANSSYRRWAASRAAAAGAPPPPPPSPAEAAAQEAARRADAARSVAAHHASLAQRVAAARARREALLQLVSDARHAMAAALARGRGRGRDAPEVLEAAGQAVSEASMADLVHFICTGSASHWRQARVVDPPTGRLHGVEAWVDRSTGVTHLRPFYAREQIYEVLLPLWKRWNGNGGGEDGGEQRNGAAAQQLLSRIREVKGEQRLEEGRRQAAVAAASGELQSLDAFLMDAADSSTLPAGDGEAAAAPAAESVLEDPELADRWEEEGGGSPTAAGAAAGLDFEAVQQAEQESEDEREEEGEEEGEQDEWWQQVAELEAAKRRQQQQPQREQRQQRASISRPAPPEDRPGPVGEAERQRGRGGRRGREALAARVGGGREDSGARPAWRDTELSSEQLLEHLLADGSLLEVPDSVRERWKGGRRCTLDDAAAHCLPLVPGMSGGELGTLMWSCATARFVHPELFGAMLRRLDDLGSALNWRGIAIAMWSCAVTRQTPPPALTDRLLRQYVQQFRRRLESPGAEFHSLCNVAWALAVFDHLTPQSFSELTSLVPPHDAAALDAITTPAWCQFFQCALYLEAKTGRHYSEFLPDHLLPRAEAHWQMRDSTTSRLQNKVADVLHSLGVPFAEEYSPRANFFGIDIAIQGEGDVRLAVEVDGPQHFSCNPPHVPLASTYMRDRLLELHGWQVVSIPFNQWAQLSGQQEKQDYLKEHVLSRLHS